jgi:nitrogenase molybdenum-iron protein alpha chain
MALIDSGSNMTGRRAADKLHRKPFCYPPLAPEAPAVQTPAWNYDWNRMQLGRTSIGGCAYGGQSITYLAPVRDLLRITNGPVGCSLYVHDNAPRPGGADGADLFSNLNLNSNFRECDIVFGGERRLAQAIDEADALFPLHAGIAVMNVCPVALIGDDTEAVAKSAARRLGKPVTSVGCSGYRRGDGVGDTMRAIAETWRVNLAPSRALEPCDVTFLSREMHGAWRHVADLLTKIGLHVVARWPAGSRRGDHADLANSRLTVAVGMDDWAKRLELEYGIPWIDADFLGLTATCDTLREIARHFDGVVADKVEDLIAAETPKAQTVIAAFRPHLAGKLYFSFGAVQKDNTRGYTDFGIRVGSSLQGWQGEDGTWRMPPRTARYQELSLAELDELLALVKPDLVDGWGQDGGWLLKRFCTAPDERSRAALERASIGFGGIRAQAMEYCNLFDPPFRRFRYALR